MASPMFGSQIAKQQQIVTSPKVQKEFSVEDMVLV
jgi:hypothetical protein